MSALSKRLGLGVPTDITARMLLIDSEGNVVEAADGEPGYIEFYGPQAAPVRHFRRQVSRDYLLEVERQKAQGKLPTANDMERRVQEIEQTQVDAVAVRVKSWRLVSRDGEVIDEPVTLEAARELFGAPEHEYLLQEALKFVGDNTNFFRKPPPT